MIHPPTASHKIERRGIANKWLTDWVCQGGARGARLARKAGLGEEVLSSEFETDQKAEMRESSRSEV